ncbi:hypothetical protein BH11PLA2_BH11PLA2_41800 [soil metagenome]
MPLYSYVCDKCEKDFEKLVSVKQSSDTKCPDCGSRQVTRQFTTPAKTSAVPVATNCRGDGTPCGAPRCGQL